MNKNKNLIDIIVKIIIIYYFLNLHIDFIILL